MVIVCLVLRLNSSTIGRHLRGGRIRRRKIRKGIHAPDRQKSRRSSRNGYMHNRRSIIFSDVVETGSSILFPLILLLQIIHLAEEIILRLLNTHSRGIGDTKQFERILIDTAFYIIIMYALQIDLAVYTLEISGRVVIRKRSEGNFDANQLGLIVIIPVEPGFHPVVGLL